MRVKNQKQKSIKAEFLKSLKWKRWRYTMLDYYNNKDCITNKPLRNRWNLHHLDLREENYTVLNDNFLCCNNLTHKFLHWCYGYYIKDPAIIDRIKNELERMKEINQADF